MFKSAQPFVITCETPMHVGSGSDLGIVDLPIQREKHTGYPKIESSSLKGSMRECFEEQTADDEKVKIHLAFGYDKDSGDNDIVKKKVAGSSDNGEFSGALGFTDARTLLFPVKSMKGVFAYVTCPKVLEKFRKELALCPKNPIQLNLPPFNIESGKCMVADKNKMAIEQKTVILEESAIDVSDDKISSLSKSLSQFIGKDEIKERLVILSDDDFRDFVMMSTEVITRTKIDNATGTVKNGMLFTEEYLPAETVLYSLALANPVFKADVKDLPLKDEENVIDFFTSTMNNHSVIQIGGNATIGKGIASIKMIDSIGNKDGHDGEVKNG
ncbi:MAG: type III-B CRISPR module RAMP protein Cmr4 [Bacteroidales bacterium]|nr:type III-B CRISPR module RAMP protein Cmr4 [Bacteroidales bacterium]